MTTLQAAFSRVSSAFHKSSDNPSTAAAEEPGDSGMVTENTNLVMGHPKPLLALRGITKEFPGVVANDHINLDIFAGEIHVILGENGAGKSTLMKIIYGFYQPDSGEMFIQGEEVTIRSPKDSRQIGIGMVFQNFSLIPAMTVAENIALFLPNQAVFLNRRTLSRQISEVAEKFHLHINPEARLGELSMGDRQKVELIKLLLCHARVLIFDEPTSILAPHEVESLFGVFNELTKEGYAILFITHKLHEALSVAHRVTVLRHGKVITTVPRAEVDERSLVSLMLGVEITEDAGSTPVEQNPLNPVVLEFSNVSTSSISDSHGLEDVSLSIQSGEILGVAGVSGNGQQQLGEVLLGLHSKSQGNIRLFGNDLDHWPVSRILQSGVSYIPEDVLGMGVVPQMRVCENLVLGEIDKFGNSGPWINWGEVKAQLDQVLNTFPLNLAGHEERTDSLSGGNIQRLVVARELISSPKLLIAYYPTRGLDVRTGEKTRKLLYDCRAKGGAILLISEDLDELLALCNRIVVMYQGKIVHEFGCGNASAYDIGLAMTGHR